MYPQSSRGSLGPTSPCPRDCYKGHGHLAQGHPWPDPTSCCPSIFLPLVSSQHREVLSTDKHRCLWSFLRRGVPLSSCGPTAKTHPREPPSASIGTSQQGKTWKWRLSPHLELGPLFTCQHLSNHSADIHQPKANSSLTQKFIIYKDAFLIVTVNCNTRGCRENETLAGNRDAACRQVKTCSLLLERKRIPGGTSMFNLQPPSAGCIYVTIAPEDTRQTPTLIIHFLGCFCV